MCSEGFVKVPLAVGAAATTSGFNPDAAISSTRDFLVNRLGPFPTDQPSVSLPVKPSDSALLSSSLDASSSPMQGPQAGSNMSPFKSATGSSPGTRVGLGGANTSIGTTGTASIIDPSLFLSATGSVPAGLDAASGEGSAILPVPTADMSEVSHRQLCITSAGWCVNEAVHCQVVACCNASGTDSDGFLV